MYLCAYHFDGDPIRLADAYEHLLAEFPPDDLLFQACAVGGAGVTVIDACPDKATHDQFVRSPEFRGALARAGLPDPRIEELGEVPHAYVEPSAVTLVGPKVAR
jgi:hypothetical protein